MIEPMVSRDDGPRVMLRHDKHNNFANTKNGECVIDYSTKVPVNEISIIFMTLQFAKYLVLHHASTTSILPSFSMICLAF